ncbi:MAG: hypothetical protein M1571_01740 [Firmicutes bacterium]|nr:hypothetical protein [Bacillota bacterium]
MTQTALLWQPAVAVLIPLGFALLLGAGGKAVREKGSYLSVCALAASFLVLAPLADDVWGSQVLTVNYPFLPPFGLSFQIDQLSLAMAVLFQLLGAVAALYSSAVRPTGEARRFQAAFLFVLACALGLVLAGDLLSLFLFFEAMSLAFFVLVIHRGDKPSVDATIKYLYMTVGGGVLYFAALAAVFVSAGSFHWQEGGFLVPGPFLLPAFFGFAAAFALKSGLFPLHFWMADVYGNAPVPAVVLSSMVLLKTGAYGMTRIIHHVFGAELLLQQGWQQVLLSVAAFTILYGSVCAFSQRDLLRRLAYSSMAQLGYVYLGIFLLTPAALVGSIYHIMSHAVLKGTMLVCAGEIVDQTGKRNVDQMAGIGWQLPLTMASFSLAALTVVGLPPLNVFISKWYLSVGALAAGQPLLVVVLLVSSMLNAAYFLPMVVTAFFGGEERHQKSLRCERLSWSTLLALVLLVAAGVVFALTPDNWPLRWAEGIATAFWPGK